MFLFLSLLIACANPKYVNPAHANIGGQEQKVATCEARFTSGYCVSLAWEKLPTEQDFGAFVFKVFRPNRADGSPVLEDLTNTPSVLLWMPDMGHGSSPVSAERLDIGTYRVAKVFFTMHGDWQIRLQVKEGGKVKDEAVLPFTF